VLQEQIKKKDLAAVDHTLIEYIKIRKNLYIVPRAIAPLLKAENREKLEKKRKELDLKVRGKGIPPPVDTWAHCGLADRIIRQLNKVYGPESSPFAVQKQAVPAIMSGRDVIGIAKTGSGKTLAFLLPMMRHIMDQPALGDGEGPIGLVLCPSRELALQIFRESTVYTKPLGLRTAAVYGGASVADQIGELKRGAEIVVCTPGRMIDILTMQAGKLISLARCSFVVMDEADRMFDMGFEPQIQMVLRNIRPDRQTCLFSATFPAKVESLAKRVLKAPIEIVVGGRSVANTAITQYAEVREEEDKFMRLLQLLGVWYERGHVLVFTDTQQRCDRVFEDLMRSGYPCLSLHGGKDQHDREQTIADFKNKVSTLMVATSVAGRGLDVAELCCVINYSCPNHLEDYVHRVGRTGRAGRKGTAYTFISPEEEQHAPTLAKALREAEQEVPQALQEMAEAFKAKVGSGGSQWAGSGYGGTGFTFDDDEMTEGQKLQDMQRRQYEIEQGLRDPANLFTDSEDDKEDEEAMNSEEEADAKTARDAAAAAAVAAASGVPGASSSALVMPGAAGDTPLERAKRAAAALAGGAAVGAGAMVTHEPGIQSMAVRKALAAAKAKAAEISAPAGAAAVAEVKQHFEEEVMINDYPLKARWKVTHRDTIDDVSEKFGVAIISRGTFCPPGQKLGPNDKKLYLLVQGHTEIAVSGARRELLRVANEETMRVGLDSSSRYSVV